jgi:hypothetical protein
MRHIPNNFAPEGASRCRALASGLRAGRRVEKNVFPRIAAVKPLGAVEVKKNQVKMPCLSVQGIENTWLCYRK